MCKGKIRRRIVIKCPTCDFEAVSQRGLKTHIARIHTASTILDDSEFPKTCELCDVEVYNKSELKKHLRTHSYKEVHYQCKECDIFCDTEMEMEVHIGKNHSDKFDCGLCSVETKTCEDLKIHLITCEIYKCENCDKKFGTLPDVKDHVKKEHLFVIDYVRIIHLKQNRTENDVIDETAYQYKEL